MDMAHKEQMTKHGIESDFSKRQWAIVLSALIFVILIYVFRENKQIIKYCHYALSFVIMNLFFYACYKGFRIFSTTKKMERKLLEEETALGISHRERTASMPENIKDGMFLVIAMIFLVMVMYMEMPFDRKALAVGTICIFSPALIAGNRFMKKREYVIERLKDIAHRKAN